MRSVRVRASLALLGAALVTAFAGTTTAGATRPADPDCQLQSANGAIKHVIYINFDNTHLTRDNPNVPSDLEQMPHLLNFMRDQGTVLNKHYTVLISHTAGGILSSLTGLYPDRMGTTVSNSYDFYRPDGTPTFTNAFKYWTAPVSATDSRPNMVNGDSGQPKNTPAPWVSYTRAGCDVGDVSAANTVLENANSIVSTTLFAGSLAGDSRIDPRNTAGIYPGQQLTIDVGGNQETATVDHIDGFFVYLTAPLTKAHAAGAKVVGPDAAGDLTNTYGVGSPEWQEGVDSQNAARGSAAANKAQADFVGLAVHCAKTSSSVCAGNTGARNDSLPDEPGGYDGYKGLFGAKYVNPTITDGHLAVNDLNGNAITDSSNPANPGFPGFDSMPASTSLAYVAQMQESGIPITYAYISDVHDNHAGGGAYGPGEEGYVNALKTYDNAFEKFFTRLAADGIDKSNTLFVFTADENDHYAGQQAQDCDGVNTPCQYNTVATNPRHGQYDVTNGGQNVATWTGPSIWPPNGINGPLVGEVGYDMTWLLGSKIDNTGYDISFDSAPSFYINGQPQAVGQDGNVVVNPLLRHFESAAANLKAFDPYIDQNQLTSVGKYFVDAPALKAIHMINADPLRTMSFTMFSRPDFYFQTFSPCTSPSKGCVNDSFAWIHGDYSNDIGQTWLGMVGPGVATNGVDNDTFTDHADIVPTIDSLTGLTPDYKPDGRAITEAFTPQAAGGANGESYRELGDVYKQLDAPYGDFAHSVIVASTNGIKANDDTYQSTESSIQSLTSERDALVDQIRDALTSSSTGHREQLIAHGRDLLSRAAALAGE